MKSLKSASITAPLLSLTLLCACAPGSYLANANEDCKKYGTPDAQTACERSHRETMKAFEKYQEKRKREDESSDSDARKNLNLCIKQPGGELLCPN
jgi:hypothetical protein